MKKQLIILAVILLSAFVLNADNVRGLTNRNLDSDKLKCIGQVPVYNPTSTETNVQDSQSNTDKRNWELIDSLYIDSIIQAGKYCGLEYISSDHTLALITNQGQLITESVEAIAKSPAWIRPDLQNILSQLSETNQLIWAELINNAVDPYIDEIAFCIAHSSVIYLSSEFSFPELFLENAELIYSTDEDLYYVQVIDYGSSTTDDDYYSTTRYWKMDEELVEVEVPKEIYYMYIVFPKITDEIAAYIDPDIIEHNSTHQNNIVDPPTGFFWRDYLYNHNDDDYPLLKDALMQCSLAWDGSLGTDNAIGAVNDWIRESLSFTSNAERPHQPIRIYKKHFGRCGEHADITAAACRVALMPCTSILAISGDHTWNEFWEERWIHWEPVNNMVDVPYQYENGWGWNFGSVFEIRSDGLLTPVTASYSDSSSTIIIYALDSNGNPIDGAKIKLAVQSGAAIKTDNFGYTDNEGKYIFIVGEGKTYYARMDSEIGNDPTVPNTVSLVVSNTLNGQIYTHNLTASGVLPEIDFTEIPVPDNTIDDYLIQVDFNVSKQVIHGNIIMDDIDDTEYYAASDEGNINFFMTDLYNQLLYENGDLFEAFNCFSDVNEGNVEFNMPIPGYGSWLIFFDNSNNLNNPQHLTSSVSLYSYNSSDLEEQEIAVVSNMLNGNYPNPFNPSTTISFSLNTENTEDTKIFIYNLKGQTIKKLEIINLKLGINEVVWNGMDENKKPVSSGIYFYKLKAGDFEQTKKMILMK